MGEKILQVEQLKAYLGAEEDPVRAVDGISFDIGEGKTLALLGESGFALEDDNRMYIPGLRVLSYNYWGSARIR